MIKDFKIFESYEEWINAPFKENFSFEKTETEKTINIEDYKEIYENIYKDRWLCRKVKSPEKIKSNIDPYNEEDWEIFGEKPVSDSSRINKLLDKGANNLTEEERKELKELSRKTKLKKYKQVTYHTGKDDPVKKYFPKKLQPSIKPL